MAKVSPFHTDSHRSVYHNNSSCPDGKRIKPPHRKPGSGGRRLCRVCKDL